MNAPMNKLLPRAMLDCAQRWLQEGQAAYVVEVLRIKGSTPRNAGTRMLVSATEVWGTIGGGHLEWQAMALARQALEEVANMAGRASHHVHHAPHALPAWQQDLALGPSLGQCCGGALTLAFRPLSADELARWPLPQPRFHLELHGAGHVGQAIVRLLQEVDCTVRWIDERDDTACPELLDAKWLAALPTHIQWLPTDAAETEVRDAPPGALHLILTHRHDLDLRITREVLLRGDAAWVGLIGSKTKRAQFRKRLDEQGLRADQIDTLVCPIGLPGIEGKEPAVIAISVVAQLLQWATLRHMPPPG